jgi:hypothetical protein
MEKEDSNELKMKDFEQKIGRLIIAGLLIGGTIVGGLLALFAFSAFAQISIDIKVYTLISLAVLAVAIIFIRTKIKRFRREIDNRHT